MIKQELLRRDPFSAATPGQSLTDTPKQWLWEQPAQFSDPVEAFDKIKKALDDPINIESMGKLMFAGISIETLTNSIMSKNFSEGLISPDVAELLKPAVVAHLLKTANNLGLTPKILNEFPKEPVSYIEAMELLKDLNPEKYVELSKKNMPEEEEPLQQGFMTPREGVEQDG